MTEPDVPLSARARGILDAARSGDPSPEALSALRARVIPPAGGGSGLAPAAGSGLMLRVAALGVGVVALGVLIAWPRSEPPPVVEPPLVAPAPAPSAPAADPLPLVAPVVAPAEDRALEPEPPMDEARYLESIRRALDRQPARALRLARRFPALYPDGLLAEEAAALEVEALARTGADARALAETFASRYPRSPYRRRIDRAIAESTSAE
jgi:hypothetical protein